jgi:hypothetical protein
MEHRIERIKEIKLLLENEINKQELILTKYEKIKNTFSVIGKVLDVIAASTGVGCIITASTKLYDCISTKIEKHKCIKLLAISKLGEINKIIGEDEDIDAKEFNTIINHYEEFEKLKADIQNKYKSNIN